jgi:HAD superfamily hydrolase (TIGR01509 family)
MKPKAVLFDVDGTILPFDGIIKHIQKTSRHFKVRVPSKKELLKYTVGYSLKESIPKLIPETRKIIDEFRDYYRKSYNADVASIKPFPYVKRVFDFIKKRKIKIGIVTTKRRIQARVTLNYYKLPYDVIIGFDDVKKRKPDPEPVLKACRLLRVNPEDCIFFGDHPFDMQAAKSAGCTAVGVLTGWGKKSNLKNSGANFIIKDLRDLKKFVE